MLFIDVSRCTMSPENITKKTLNLDMTNSPENPNHQLPKMAWCNTPPRLDNHPWWPKACHHDVVPSSTFASTPGDENPNDLMEDMWISRKWKKYIMCTLEPKWSLVLIEKGLELEGWLSKIKVSWVLGIYPKVPTFRLPPNPRRIINVEWNKDIISFGGP